LGWGVGGEEHCAEVHRDASVGFVGLVNDLL
jgi:hypothetical protein